MSSMLVVGSVAFDTIHNPRGVHPRILGGSATYASVAASYFTSVDLVGVVGRDFPESATRLLRDRGVDLTGLEAQDGKTFHWEGRYSDDLSSRTSLATELNVFAAFQPKLPEAYRSAPFVMLGNIDPDLQRDVLDQVRKPRLVVADTMNFWIEGKPEALAKTLARVDVLVVNEEEARQLGKSHSLVKVARTLQAMGPRIVIIKKGEHGAVLFDGEDIFIAPAYPLGEVVDPTGAGDTFAGGMLGYLARAGQADHASLRRAIVYGSALASFCVEGIGLERLTNLTRADIDARYESFRKLVHFSSEREIAQDVLSV